MIYTPLARFKDCVGRGVPVPSGVRLAKSASIAFGHDAERRRMFTISTARVDREGDSIAVAGWELDAYMQNPVVLWGHDGHAPPIGRAVEAGIDGDALKAVVEFVPFDMPVVGQQAEMVFRMCAQGFLSACSVGFRPLEFEVAKERAKDGDWFPPLNFQRQELLELSVVSIPANPDALIEPEQQRALRVDERAEAAARTAEEARQATKRAAIIALRRRTLRTLTY